MREREIIDFLLGICEGLLRSRGTLVKIAAQIEGWERQYEQSLVAPLALEDVEQQIANLRGVVDLVLAGASVESLTAFHVTGPTRVN